MYVLCPAEEKVIIIFISFMVYGQSDVYQQTENSVLKDVF